MSHSIRLRGPWDFSIAGTQIAGRIEFPCDWSEIPSPAAVAVRFRRYFHLPTGLEPGNQVLIVLRCQAPHLTAQLNGAELALERQSDEAYQADVTRQLAARNELTINLEPPSPAPIHPQEPSS